MRWCALLLLAGCAASKPELVTPPARSEFSTQALQLTLPRFGGGEAWSSADDRGHVVLLDVWAEWCDPCRDSLPLIGDIAMNAQVNIVGSNPQPDRTCSPYPWPGVAVPNHAGSIYQADLFMQTFSVDPEDFVGYNREQVASLLDNMATEHMQQRVSADIVDPADGRTFATTRCTVQLIDGAGKPLPLSDRIRRALGAAQQPAAWCAESPH